MEIIALLFYMKFYNAEDKEINLINYTKESQDMPYEAEWTVREESYSDSKKVQWATKSDGKETYKRSYINGSWSNWLLVEGECLLWKGTLVKGNSITIPRLKQFKRFRIYGTSIGFIDVSTLTGDKQYNGINSENGGDRVYITMACVEILDTTFTNYKVCRFYQKNPTVLDVDNAEITQIIGIP